MAISYQHPKVKVHVGDGFKFLDDYKNEFDVIITDSSDPEGPAEALFQKPYFQLLFGALKEGGVISTQGCRFSFVEQHLYFLWDPHLYAILVTVARYGSLSFPTSMLLRLSLQLETPRVSPLDHSPQFYRIVRTIN